MRLHCCECGRFIENVSDEDYGHIGTNTLCEFCYYDDCERHLEER